MDGEEAPSPLPEEAAALLNKMERPDVTARRLQAEEALAQADQAYQKEKQKENIQSVFSSFWNSEVHGEDTPLYLRGWESTPRLSTGR